jgi:hypothetical protein
MQVNSFDWSLVSSVSSSTADGIAQARVRLTFMGMENGKQKSVTVELDPAQVSAFVSQLENAESVIGSCL